MDEETRIQISLAHSYLEVARAVFSAQSASEKNRAGAMDVTTGFGVLSVTIIYAYLALESFINYHFCQIYLHSKKAHEISELVKRSKPNMRIVPVYKDFFKKYGNTPLEELRPELKEKIKDVCNAYKIPQVHNKEPRLWQDFCDILKPARDFLVHAVPEPELFQRHMQKLIEETRAGKYVEIAIGIMGYFYDQTNTPKPSWLKSNELLQFQAVRPAQHKNGA